MSAEAGAAQVKTAISDKYFDFTGLDLPIFRVRLLFSKPEHLSEQEQNERWNADEGHAHDALDLSFARKTMLVFIEREHDIADDSQKTDDRDPF